MNLHLEDQNYLQINMIVFNGEKLVFQVKNALQSFSCSFFDLPAEKVGHPWYRFTVVGNTGGGPWVFWENSFEGL
jgi:hypothetical protein